MKNSHVNYGTRLTPLVLPSLSLSILYSICLLPSFNELISMMSLSLSILSFSSAFHVPRLSGSFFYHLSPFFPPFMSKIDVHFYLLLASHVFSMRW